MDWYSILQALRDVLTLVGASKLVYEGYRQIKKTVRFQRSRRKLWNTGKRISYHLNQVYKKAFGVRYNERFVRHSLQKKSSDVGIPVEIAGIPIQKKPSINSILSFFNSILFLKKSDTMIFHRNRMIYRQACG